MPCPWRRRREFIARLVPRVQAVEKLAIRSALGRVLASDVISTIAVPAHDNSAMDGVTPCAVTASSPPAATPC